MALDNTQVPLINGKAYSWADISVMFFGIRMMGITSISYKDMQEKTNEYGAGSFPVSRSYGKYEATCEIEIELKEMVAIQAAAKRAGANRIQDIPAFPIDVSYMAEAGRVINDRICNAEFTDNVREGKTGDGRLVVKAVLVVSHIEWDNRANPSS